MYKLDSYFESDTKVELPDCMYKHKEYYTEDDSRNEQNPLSQELIELEQRQEAILTRLDQLKKDVADLTNSVPSASTACQDTSNLPAIYLGPVIHDIVINANPQSPPLALFVLYEQLQQCYRVLPKVHIHSSVSSLSSSLTSALTQNGGKNLERSDCQIALTLIWKDVQNGPELKVDTSVQTAILGEGAVIRYLARLLNPPYDSVDAVTATEIDTWIDTSCNQLLKGNKKEKAAAVKSMNSKLGKCDWLVGSSLSLADVAAWSALSQTQQVSSSPENVKNWYKKCSQNPSFRVAVDLCKTLNS